MNMHMPTGLINNGQMVNSGVNPSNHTQRPSNWLLYTYMLEPTLAVAVANSQGLTADKKYVHNTSFHYA